MHITPGKVLYDRRPEIVSESFSGTNLTIIIVQYYYMYHYYGKILFVLW